MRTLLLTAAALAAPHAAKVGTSSITNAARSPQPSVSYTIDSIVAPIAPRHAYDDLIAEAAEKYKLDPHMIRAVMQAESAFNAMAVSPVGALGLMQLMPAVAEELGATDPLDPRQNIMAGAKYLRQLLNAHRGNVTLALASYNAGPGNVAKYRANSAVQRDAELREESDGASGRGARGRGERLATSGITSSANRSISSYCGLNCSSSRSTPGSLELADAFGDLFRRPDQPGAQPAVGHRVILEADALLELGVGDPLLVVRVAARALPHVGDAGQLARGFRLGRPAR